MRRILYFLFVAACLTCWSGQALADKQAYTTTYRHAMGDDETRTEARRKCLAGAKRRILEQAGTYVSSSTTVQNYALTDDQITEVSAGVMEVEVLEEKTELEGDALVISMTVKALLDPDEVRARLDEAVARAEAGQSDQEARISELERQLEELKQKQETAEAERDADGGDTTEATVDTGGDDESVASEMARTLGRLLPVIAVRILTGMPADKRGDVLRRMDPDARSRLQDQVERQSGAVEESLSVQPQAAPETVRTLPDPRQDPSDQRDKATRRQELRERRDRNVLYPWTPRDTGRQP